MKSLAFVLTTILTLCVSLQPTLQSATNSSTTKNYDLVPLYLLQPNFLTTSNTEVTNYLRKNGFQQKNAIGFVAKNNYDCNGNATLIPVYRFHNDAIMQYILSTNPSPPNNTTLPYTPDGVAFYTTAALNDNCGPIVPLYSYWVYTHYVYTTDKESADAMLVQADMGGAIYIWLNDKPPVVSTTSAPTTSAPTTSAPTTYAPTTSAPTTSVPTTSAPTTFAPTTSAPTTSAPTTSATTTKIPTTRAPVTTVPTTTKSPVTQPTPPNCPLSTVPLWRLYRQLSDNHFYTTSEPEAQNAVRAYSYVREGSPGKVVKSASDCKCEKNFVAIYRLYKPGNFDDHFYTASEDEAINAQSKYGYNREGIEYYCSPTRDVCGATIPLYRYWRGTDHFYTASIEEGNRNVIPYGGIYEGIICYIWP